MFIPYCVSTFVLDIDITYAYASNVLGLKINLSGISIKNGFLIIDFILVVGRWRCMAIFLVCK
jgi:hypothetical protein